MADRPTEVLRIVSDFITGVRYFGQGFGMLGRRPRLLLTGMLPAVLTAAILLGAMIALIANIDHLAALITPFADHWSGGERLVTRIAAGLALVSAAVLLGLVGFTAVTLVVGGPFYENIAERIEDDLGITAGHLDLSWWKQFISGLRDGLVLLLRSLVFTIPLFLAGFLPVVGQIVVPVLVALTTAWFMALEVVAVPFYRRGIGLRDRTAMLRRRRTLALGLGLPAVLHHTPARRGAPARRHRACFLPSAGGPTLTRFTRSASAWRTALFRRHGTSSPRPSDAIQHRRGRKVPGAGIPG